MKLQDKRFLFGIAIFLSFVMSGIEILSFIINDFQFEALLKGIVFFIIYLALCYGYDQTK